LTVLNAAGKRHDSANTGYQRDESEFPAHDFKDKEDTRALVVYYSAHMTKIVSPADAAASLTEFWSPRVIGEVDDAYVKVAKVQGSLAWHSHQNEDELFLVLKGSLKLEMEDEVVELSEGEMYVIPKGVRHNPVAEQECHLLLIERKSTLHTGDIVTEKTRSVAEQLRNSPDQ
jgi:mannose-6-phosphate isomerase-like protein (cupin superfamily)